MKSWLLAIVIVAGLAARGRAEEPKPKKLAALDKAPTRAADKAKRNKQLARLVGKPPAPIVNLHNHWTSEVLVVDAKADATVTQDQLDELLRCHFTNQKTQMDLRLVGVLVGAAMHFQSPRIEIVSGFRAPKYNLMLRKKGHEVARNSQHSGGNAVDFRIPGVTTKQLHSYVKSLKVGGVGIYLESEFVHADTGPIRFWAGR